VNPQISREGELKPVPVKTPKNIAVVGAGPAGLEAARVAALRGHKVTIYESQKRLGGLLNEASAPEFKADIRPFMEYLITAVDKLGVTIIHKKATAAELKKFDTVICATGSSIIIPKIPGVNKSIVTNALDVLNNKVKVGKNVIVAGGGLVGSETAIHLAQNGHKVTIVEMLPQIMRDVGSSDTVVYNEKIAENGIKVMTSTRLESIEDSGATVLVKGRSTEHIKADTIVLALGFRSNSELADELTGKGIDVRVIGDAVKPGKIFDAVHTGYRVGLKV
jgi:NADPH-dependent 2,4-dienoyl-CoA reductase/sulfur reductase-like enzyme